MSNAQALMEPEQNHDQSPLEDLLKSCLLFKDAPESAMSVIESLLERFEVAKGDPIILENEATDFVHFIESGSAEVIKFDSVTKKQKRLALLKEGSCFSEFSVLTRTPRSASVFAVENCVLLRMSGTAFLSILEKFPPVAKALVKSLAQRQFQNFSDRAPPVESYKKFPISSIRDVLLKTPLEIWKKAGALPLRFEAEVLTIAVKDPYQTSHLELTKKSLPQAQVNICWVSDKDFEVLSQEVGEKKNSPPIPTKVPPHPPLGIPSLLKGLPYFSHLSPNHFQQLASYTKSQTVQPGEVIFAPGALADQIYVIETGRVLLSRILPATQAFVQVGILEASQSTGEIPMLAGQSQFLQARALTEVKLFTLPKAVAEKALDSLVVSIPFAQFIALQIQRQDQQSGVMRYKSNLPIEYEKLSGLLPKNVIQQYRILPLQLIENELTLGVLQPNDELISPIISRYLSIYRVNSELISEAEFNSWSKNFSAETAAKPNAPVKGPTSDKPHSGVASLSSKASSAAGMTATQSLDRILQESFDLQASDLHFEPSLSGFVIRNRIDGILVESDFRFTKVLGEEMVNRIKVMGQMDLSQHMVPQDGQLKINLPGGPSLTARVSIMPTKYGENAVLRIVRNRTSTVPLSMLAPDLRTIQILTSIARRKQGLFLVTGPTGSGKTTTLYSLLNELNHADVNVITLEDPVELEIPGITQVEMNEKQNLTFAKSLRSVLRQDPNVIMVGEIRDPETAKTVVEAAQTGHLVISTLHSNSAVDVGLRLSELGVSPIALSSTLLGAVAQRLIRSICKTCKTEVPLEDSQVHLLQSMLGLENPPEHTWKGKGCTDCRGSGYSGRIPVFEIWKRSNETDLVFVNKGSPSELLGAAKLDGFISLHEFSLKMILSGLTTFDEVERQFGNALVGMKPDQSAG